MRQQLAGVLPAFAHWFGLMPWDVERLTDREVDEFYRWLRKATEKK